MSKFDKWLWGVAEKMEWSGLPPRRFWKWLIRRQDRKAGYDFTYDP